MDTGGLVMTGGKGCGDVVLLLCCCAVVKRSAVTIWLLLTTGTDRGGMELIPTDGSQLRHACGNKRRGEFFLQ